VVQGRLSQKGTVLASGAKYAIDSLGRLSTPPESGARFVTDQGVDVDVAANSTADLSFSGDQQRISLNRGSIRLSVPKLKPGASLSVATPDAIVTVHGTRFSVEIGEGKSCVRVSEGIVSVARGETIERLTAGQQSSCGPSEQSSPSDTRGNAQAEADMPRARARSKNSGTLTQENQLFQSALAAEQSGNFGQAELLANRLLTRYAASPMAPDARAILTRVRAKRTHTSSTP
jgi:hypothetical protein